MSEPSKSFGRYSLVRKIAQGGMAEIFLAKVRGEGGFEKKVIIKRILPRFSQNQDFIKMLVHEAKVAVHLQHANIVQIYDLGRVKETYFISMEYIKGKDLRTVSNRLKQQGLKLPQEMAVFVAREACKGLDYAHSTVDVDGTSLNLVHRDISPPNILLSLDGEVKIIDFGIAKATAKATDTQAGVFKGKFAYMSPEQATGQRIDRRTDIFATGLVLFEMLTHRKLLEGDTDVETLERAKRVDDLDLQLKEAGVPPELERIVRKSLAGDRSKRYQTAGEMARELSIYLNIKYPTFTETELSVFLRRLFNLDRRGEGAGLDETDPSFLSGMVGSLSGGEPVRLGVGTTENLAGGSFGAASAAQSSGDYWPIEEALSEELEIYSALSDVSGGSSSATTQRLPNRSWDQEANQGSWGQGQQSHDSVERTLHSAQEPLMPSDSQGGLLRYLLIALLLAGVVIAGLTLMPSQRAAELPQAALSVRQDMRQILGLVSYGQLVVDVQPEGAEIYINGKLRSTESPFVVSLPLGQEHVLAVQSNGFESQESLIQLSEEGREVSVSRTLSPKRGLGLGPGILKIGSDPPGAAIRINGELVPALLTPAVVQGLPIDKAVKVSLELASFHVFEVEAQADEAGSSEVSGTLAMKPIKLSVTSVPSGAEISLDKRVVGTTPLVDALLEPEAPYQLTVSKSGFVVHKQRLNTVLGRDINLDINLKAKKRKATTIAKKPVTQKPKVEGKPVAQKPITEARPQASLPTALVNIIVIPGSLQTQIYLNDELLGPSPVRNRRLQPGDYVVRLRNEEANLDRTLPKKIRPDDTGGVLNWEFEITTPGQ